MKYIVECGGFVTCFHNEQFTIETNEELTKEDIIDIYEQRVSEYFGDNFHECDSSQIDSIEVIE